MLVLGVDPGTTNFGIAIVTDQQLLVYSRTVNLMQGVQITYSSIALAVCLLMEHLFRVFKFQHVCVEMQLREHMIAVMQSIAVWACMRNVHYEIVPATVWRKRVGLRNSGKYHINKSRSFAYVKERFYCQPSDHNSAEAILIAVGACLPYVNQ